MKISLKGASKLFLLTGIIFLIYWFDLKEEKELNSFLFTFVGTSAFSMFFIAGAFFISHIYHEEEINKRKKAWEKEKWKLEESYNNPVKVGLRLYGLKAPKGHFYGTLVGVLRNGEMRPFQTVFDGITSPFLHIRLYDEKKEAAGFKLGAPFFKRRSDGKIEMLNNIYDVRPFSEGWVGKN